MRLKELDLQLKLARNWLESYILDEPSIGLHQRDNEKLINSLMTLRDIGNSVIVVEHDKDMIERQIM